MEVEIECVEDDTRNRLDDNEMGEQKTTLDKRVIQVYTKLKGRMS
jgi:hypothetical protein